MNDNRKDRPKFTTKEFFDEFWEPRGWAAGGAGLIIFALVAEFISSGKLDMKPDYEWHAVALIGLIPGLIFWLLGDKFSRTICIILSVSSVIAAELALYILVGR
ncbi:hypothetical protein F7230_06515 [Corynebacterium sp. 320]|uniref:Uncharacterized protein n=1 Tax=Corynebacterium zhongnanshanii TaxID=2768834 RepID=A0ABQ6VCS5_9CORY|nr:MULTISPECIES: hypothetical protein [Corynebacterium]KAB1503183.1 hypothetical protein F7230_06515 [Corynebacterium sp. 320]KAB1550604.1 hypothetical protein F7233_08670 [Corynebacterium sp. 321]KAB1550965.1 hypothetical protein F7232_07850 [Corynebacterium sp. 319]KAB3519979.1 hypothetical protein F8377_08740 [Corynebacterium zhongnanshanii]KAB3526980.1 hypothetical protein F8354_06515 [Corynebacterium sp. 250]